MDRVDGLVDYLVEWAEWIGGLVNRLLDGVGGRFG